MEGRGWRGIFALCPQAYPAAAKTTTPTERTTMQTITAAGTYFWGVEFDSGKVVTIDVAGDDTAFNGATITLGYKAIDGEFTAYHTTDGETVSLTSRGGFDVRVPRQGQVGIQVEGTPTGVLFDVFKAS